jgi:signal transduction histidine kinase
MHPGKLNADSFVEIFPHMENILHCGLYAYNFESKEMFWSKGFYDILGLDVATPMTEEFFFGFVNAENLDLVTTSFKNCKENKTPYKIEFSIKTARGLFKRIHAETYCSDDPLGKMSQHNGVIKDVTESYYYKRALEQKITQLDKSNRNLQEFVYAASHDLQEPLRKIYTFTERLNIKFGKILPSEGTMFVKRILSSTRNMQTLLSDLLNFSRVSFDEKKLEKISINTCLKNVIAELDVIIEETKTTISYDLFKEIEAYPSQIQQLFSNLINNAIKFRKAMVPAKINITSEIVDGSDFERFALIKDVEYVKIKVQDNGIGFDQEFSEKIFMIFQRLNGKSEYPGSGIGLAICKKIVDNHHGFIGANSEINKGATFTILLPQTQY